MDSILYAEFQAAVRQMEPIKIVALMEWAAILFADDLDDQSKDIVRQWVARAELEDPRKLAFHRMSWKLIGTALALIEQKEGEL